MLEVRVIRPDTSEEAQSVMTNREGRLTSEITVESDTDVVISSLNKKIAQFEVAGPASEFASGRMTQVGATPMINAESACREVRDGVEYVRFSYTNYNDSDNETLIPISSQSTLLYQDPMTPADDLLLNDIRLSTEQAVLPSLFVRTITPGEAYQSFLRGRGSFTVPYDARNGALTWNLIGKTIVVTSATPLCDAPIQPTCKAMSARMRRTVYTELIRTVSKTLTEGEKARQPKATKNYVPPSATVPLKQVVKTVLSLKGAYICEPGAVMIQSCQPKPFPRQTLLKLHTAIFRKYKARKPALFRKIQKTYHDEYRNFLTTSFPEQIYRCPSK
jgi:hypothetical protein